MKEIKYFSMGGLPHTMLVRESGPDHMALSINGLGVVLNTVQVDKLRQQMHGWLHERANQPGGLNWQEMP